LANPASAKGLSEMLENTPFLTLFTSLVWPSNSVMPTELDTDEEGGDSPLNAIVAIAGKDGMKLIHLR
jgi:hypothetical protein